MKPHPAVHFKTAMEILDATEPQLREIIESGLMDVTEPGGAIKKNMVEKAVQNIMTQIAAVRSDAIKRAFRHLRANLDQ